MRSVPMDELVRSRTQLQLIQEDLDRLRAQIVYAEHHGFVKSSQESSSSQIALDVLEDNIRLQHEVSAWSH